MYRRRCVSYKKKQTVSYILYQQTVTNVKHPASLNSLPSGTTVYFVIPVWCEDHVVSYLPHDCNRRTVQCSIVMVQSSVTVWSVATFITSRLAGVNLSAATHQWPRDQCMSNNCLQWFKVSLRSLATADRYTPVATPLNAIRIITKSNDFWNVYYVTFPPNFVKIVLRNFCVILLINKLTPWKHNLLEGGNNSMYLVLSVSDMWHFTEWAVFSTMCRQQVVENTSNFVRSASA